MFENYLYVIILHCIKGRARFPSTISDLEDIRQSRQQTGTRDDSACVEESIYDVCMSAFKGVGGNEHGRNHDRCRRAHLQEYDQERGDPKLQIFCCHPAWNPFAFILIKLKSRGNFEMGKNQASETVS